MKLAGQSSPWLIVPMAIVIIIGYFIFAYWECRKKSLSNLNELNNVFKEDINTSLLEPLYYTFKTKSFKYKGSNFGLLDDMVNVVKASSNELIIHYMMWCFFMGLLILEFICYHKYLLDLPVPDIDQWIINIRAVIHKWNDVK
jgi:cbb3-type cytochrome oxidase subunit 3